MLLALICIWAVRYTLFGYVYRDGLYRLQLRATCSLVASVRISGSHTGVRGTPVALELGNAEFVTPPPLIVDDACPEAQRKPDISKYSMLPVR
jgi:hypothetical protein